MNSEPRDDQAKEDDQAEGEQSETFHPAGLALFLEAYGALPERCIDVLRERGYTVDVAPGRAGAKQQRLGSNVIKLV